MRMRRAVPVLVAVGALALSACGPATGGGRPGAAGGAPAARAPTGATVSPGAVAERLRFTATTVDGATFNGASLAGRPVVLWFWAPWCPTCGAEAPQVSRLAARFAGRVSVVGVAGLDKLDAMRWFVARAGVSGLTNLADESGAVWRRFGVTAQATYVLLDGAGNVAYRGFLDGAELADRAAGLVG